MLTLTIPHKLPLPQAQRAVMGLAPEVMKYGVSMSWAGTRATLMGMATGEVSVTGESVMLKMTLSPFATMAGVTDEKVRGILEPKLKALLGVK